VNSGVQRSSTGQRRSRPRLPWKRGPIAARVASNADVIKSTLSKFEKRFFSLRQTAKIFGVSTQPVRDWVRLKFLSRDGPRGQFPKSEIERFLNWLVARAEPFPNENYTRRLFGQDGPRQRFATLRYSKFVWPPRRKALTPRELGDLIGCDPSLIRKAIAWEHWERLGRRRSYGRWEITRKAWQSTFFCSQITKPRLPMLPKQPWFSTRDAAQILKHWGVEGVSHREIREMIRAGESAGTGPVAGKRLWRVARKSLEKKREALLTA
jgi:hypothetical protein